MWIVQHKGVIKHVHDLRPPDSISGLLKDKLKVAEFPKLALIHGILLSLLI